MTDKKAALEKERDKKITELEGRLNYRFSNRELIRLALTHSSLRDPWTDANERLEFLGDSVIGLAVATHLFNAFPTQTEGDLTRLKSSVVSGAALVEIGKRFAVASYLRVGKGIRKGRGVPQSLIANALEAIVGAIYLDSNFETVRDLIVSWLEEDIKKLGTKRAAANYKAALQQSTQRLFGKHPTYSVLDEVGPDHKKEFVIAARIGDRLFAPAKGKTKKIAEQRAARLALRELKRDGTAPDRAQSAEES